MANKKIVKIVDEITVKALDNKIEELVGNYGELMIFERLAAHFDHLLQEGVVWKDVKKQRVIAQADNIRDIIYQMD
jgi:hypothetical protein